MRFAPDEEQLEFASTVRMALENTCTPADLRAAWGGAVGEHVGTPGGDGRVPAAWEALVEIGALALMVGEEQGGLGLGDEHLALLGIEAGRAGLPEPFSATAGVAAGLLGADGAGDAAASWSERVAAGARFGVGFGDRPIVAMAEVMDAVLLLDGERVALAELEALVLEPLESVDGARRLCRVVGAPGAEVLLEGPAAEAAAEVAIDRAATLDAAELVGLSRRMLELTCAYVGEREQFGVPVGSFQAIKHHLADASLAVEFSEPLVAVAAHRLALGQPAGVESSMAKLRASQAADLVSRVSLQCHGAIGYTVECDLHLYMKRSWALRRQHGGDDWHRARIRAALLDPDG
jgi:alkylation response protein AidB-like acyl-CoA dehydrogenase